MRVLLSGAFLQNHKNKGINMNEKEKFVLIEKTIKEVKGNYSIERLILDCADKLSLSISDVKRILIVHNSELLRNQTF